MGDYYAFDGWAIGMLGKVYSETNYEPLYDQGFCLTADKNCLILNETSGVYSITTFTSARKPAANYPDLQEIAEAVEYGLYGFDDVQWVLPESTENFAYRFLRKTDLAYWQVSDPDNVWQVVYSDDYDNVSNPDFIFANAKKLGAAAALAIGAATLL